MAMEGENEDHVSLGEHPDFDLSIPKLCFILKTRLSKLVDSPECAPPLLHDFCELTCIFPETCYFPYGIQKAELKNSTQKVLKFQARALATAPRATLISLGDKKGEECSQGALTALLHTQTMG